MSELRSDTPAVSAEPAEIRNIFDLCLPLITHWRALLLLPIIAAAAGFASTYVIEPTFTAQTTLLPPEKPQQSANAAAMQSLGALAGLVGVGGGRTPTDQFAALLQSTTVQDRLIDQFQLLQVYDKDYRMDARHELEKRVRVSIGKKDGLLTIEVDDKDPQRAAAMANQHVTELRKLTSSLAVTEAQQRRIFFENQLKETQLKLALAQRAVQASGFSQGALKAEPKAAAEGYAHLRAELTSAQVRLQTLRGLMTESSIEVKQQQSQVGALQSQLTALERNGAKDSEPDYISKYRDFKYQESMLEMMSRQYELARVDESREGTLIQVVDTAMPPEKRSKPKRLLVTAASGVLAAVLVLLWIYISDSWRRALSSPSSAASLARLRQGSLG